jgi:CHAT domain-containing protein/tetratricopeptide (TPR) repeat protein
MLLALLALVVAQDVEPPLLEPGGTIRGEVTGSEAVVETSKLSELYGDERVTGRIVRVRVERAGPYRLELRSHFFAAYLVLRDVDGRDVAEADGGWIRDDALLVVELEADTDYRVVACALRGRGSFELTLLAGAPPELTAEQRTALEIEDAEAEVRAIEEHFGPNSDELAYSLRGLGLVNYHAGRYAAAPAPIERALAIYEALHGPDHIYVGATLNELGTFLLANGQLDAALPVFERSLALAVAEHGPDDKNVATALNNLGALHQARGEFDAALEAYEQVLAVRERLFGENHPGVANSLNNLATLLDTMGRYSAARAYCQRAVGINEELYGPEHRSVATALHNLGAIEQDLGNLDAARVSLERALEVRERVLGPEHPETAMTLAFLGEVVNATGDFGAARPLLERALAIRERAHGPDHPEIAVGLQQLASLLLGAYDLDEAERCARRALAIREAALGPEHFRNAAVLDLLGLVLQAQGRHDEARTLHERALEIRLAAHGPEHPSTANSMNNLALSLQEAGRFEEAERLLRDALTIQERALGPASVRVGVRLNNLGILYHELGRLDEARRHLDRALGIFERALGAHHPETAQALYHLTMLLLDMELERVAWQRLRRYQDGLLAHSRVMLAAMSEVERCRFLARVLSQVKLGLSVAEELDDDVARARAYEGLLAWKGESGRLLTASRRRLAAETSPEARRKIEELRAVQAELSKLMLEATAPVESSGAARLVELRALRNRLELELQRVGAPAGVQERVSLDAVRASLSANTAVVDFFVRGHYRPAAREDGDFVTRGSWGEPRLSAWVTRADGEEAVHVDLGPAADVEQAVGAYLAHLHGGDEKSTRGQAPAPGDGADTGAGPALRRRLFDPVAAHLDGIETVVVSADAFLGTLPFEVLPLEDGRFAIERFAFIYRQDLTSLAREAESEPTAGSLMIVGDVDFGAAFASTRRGAWASLPATADEVRAVLELHEEVFADRADRLKLSGTEPSEGRLKQELPRHTVLHLATHGFFEPSSPDSAWAQDELDSVRHTALSTTAGRLPGLLSGLVCAEANSHANAGRDDGFLTAEEVSWLDLGRVDLVVLSACETGLGHAQRGEGLIGLRRAFRTAGARAVVSSLWSIQDESTATLMREFYRNLWVRGMDRLEALRAAQLTMLEENRELHGNPLPSTWGAFVLSGERR